MILNFFSFCYFYFLIFQCTFLFGFEPVYIQFVNFLQFFLKKSGLNILIEP